MCHRQTHTHTNLNLRWKLSVFPYKSCYEIKMCILLKLETQHCHCSEKKSSPKNGKVFVVSIFNHCISLTLCFYSFFFLFLKFHVGFRNTILNGMNRGVAREVYRLCRILILGGACRLHLIQSQKVTVYVVCLLDDAKVHEARTDIK